MDSFLIKFVVFQCNEDKLKKAFAAFGEITDVVIPKKSGLYDISEAPWILFLL